MIENRADRIKEELAYFRNLFLISSAICASLTSYLALNFDPINISKLMITSFALDIAILLVIVYSNFRIFKLFKKL